MLSLPPSVRVFVCLRPTDMRRSFDGLAALVEQFVGQSPLSGHLFLFRNRSGDRVKILYWDRDGYALWYKRLEQGTFRLPESEAEASSLEIDATQLVLILGGLELAGAKRQRRFALKGREINSRCL